MLAKKLELKKIAECKLQRPEVPLCIQKVCDTYIMKWNEETFEELNKINSPFRKLKSPPRKNNLKGFSPTDGDSVKTTDNIEYFVHH